MAAINDNLQAVAARIRDAARAAGRDPSMVRLLAVTKTQPPSAVEAAYAAGQRSFGENRVAEAAAKFPALKAEFEAKLAAEPAFAADGDARLQWFYERTPFYDDHYRLYPVGREN